MNLFKIIIYIKLININFLCFFYIFFLNNYLGKKYFKKKYDKNLKILNLSKELNCYFPYFIIWYDKKELDNICKQLNISNTRRILLLTCLKIYNKD